MVDKKTITAGVFITLTLLLGGAYVMVDKDKTYYCESKDLVGYCEKLSSGIGARCYYNGTKYKTCNEGWQKIDNFIEPENLCYSDNNYTYCCESKQMEKGACDFIIRSKI